MGYDKYMIGFTVEMGLAIQKGNLAKWKKVLKASYYKKLVDICEEANKKLKPKSNGSKVFRGVDVSHAVLQLMEKF